MKNTLTANPLFDRFSLMWKTLNRDVIAHHDEYKELIAHYQEPHRKYHNLAHIAHCFLRFDWIKSHLQQPAAVMFAIWYHDAIYTTRSTKNEEESAALAKQVLIKSSASFTFMNTVEQMILATKHANEIRFGNDCKIFLDIDLSILGEEPAAYDTYARQIRDEYSWVDPEQYRIGRSQLLYTLLSREHIFHTLMFQNRYEAQARCNLRREIQLLEKK